MNTARTVSYTHLDVYKRQGVDIGGTNTKFGLVNHRGEILDKGSIRTDEFEKVEDFIEALYNKVKPLIDEYLSLIHI